ncbi:CK1/TTBK protein kinase [Aphanomyces invadans]|uniref:Casein kinase I n=1 Tax=Aphanomyces invadans TaxID=157072 RepID=A0A024TEN9_9STRA|nr:CK1/TTBK protein kinase [Aphanomyces invadans]ETV91812.1 CK1/TTBK protein kinase [Aphanomyces invadans]|eukprot:XP_008879449.1 CK1/TTBK protein kinase [Aphanomyces invadans]
MEEKNLLLNGEILLNRWRVVEKIGEGTFSQIYTASDMTNSSHRVAVKVEAPSQMKPVLEWESQVLVALQRKSPYVCKYHHHGKHGENFILVMELLGDNMSKIRQQPDAVHGVPLTKCVSAAIQMLDCLESFHHAGFIHRDIKASNFALSNGKDPKRYFIIDFGLSKQHLDPQGAPIPPRDKAEFRGTSMYASLQAHRREDLGRRDDLWSWMYLVLDFVRGELPWAHDAQKKNREVVVELKEYFTEQHPEQMVEGLPGARHLLAIMEYLKTLGYGDVPNYSYIRKAIKAVEDVNDEASLLHEWDALRDTKDRAAKWVKALKQGVMDDDMLLKVAKHYGSFFGLEDAPDRFKMQEHIWKVEKRLKTQTLSVLPPTIQSYGERRQAEQRKKVESLQRRREADMAVRQNLGSVKRLTQQLVTPPSTLLPDIQQDAARVKLSTNTSALLVPGESPTVGTPTNVVVEMDISPLPQDKAVTMPAPRNDDRPSRPPKRSRWDA